MEQSYVDELRDRTETVATLPTPPPATSATVAAGEDGWPCARPPIVTEHQEQTLEQMTNSGQPELVQQAADLRSKICAHWAAKNASP